MTKTEAIEWVTGKRSMQNIVPQDPFDTWQVRVAKADAATTEQAYWAIRAYEEFPHLFGEDGYETPLD